MAKNYRVKDIIWEELFEQYNIQKYIDSFGFAKITSEQINSLKPGVQARLQAKFDNSSQLPPIFKRQGLGILPVSNGVYHIGKFDIFKEFEIDLEDVPLTYLYPEMEFETISLQGEKSEANALHIARVSGVFKHFFNNRAELTQSGRMKVVKPFVFNINNISLEVLGNQQVEIDALLETENEVIIVEAKNGKPKDFCVRQLYYPLRVIQNRYAISKPIKPLYYLYSGETHYLLEYKFNNPVNYNSIEFIGAQAYRVDLETISESRIRHIIQKTKVIAEDKSKIFPQANSMTKIIDLVEWMYRIETDTLEEFEEEDSIYKDNGVDHKAVALRYGIDIRQGQYYATSLDYLGFASRAKVKNTFKYKLTKMAYEYLGATQNQKIDIMLSTWFRHRPIRAVILECLKNKGPIPKDQALSIIIENGAILNQEKSTAPRRTEGVLGWYKWLSNLMQ
ncbi:hypothetical protein V7112_19435 [Bacillus sp. JJ1566]|uniref:type II restriction enzyme n=1 Tax=Bacillus sp. JJ1566 TaxID=3122961 RepID=UPI002FFE068C